MKKLFLLSVGLLLVGCQHTATPAPRSEMPNPEGKVLAEEAMVKTDKYQDFSADSFAVLKGKKPFVLFFHAEWCKTCRNWEAKILENHASLPANTMILKVNFDTEKDLVSLFEVKSQSTAVFFDAAGNVTQSLIDPGLDKVSAHFTN